MRCRCIMQSSYDNGVVFGGFFARLAAYILDSAIVSIMLLCIRFSTGFLFSFMDWKILFQYTLEDIFLYLCGAAYFIILTYGTGATLGKRAMGLRVVNVNGEKLSLFNLIYRETVGRFLSGLFMCIGYIMIGIDRQKRGLHDVLGDTRVIYMRK